MTKNVIINGREYGTREAVGGTLVEDFIEASTLFFVRDLEDAGITVEEVKPKFEDLPAGYYASTQLDWGDSVVYTKTPNGEWFATGANAENSYSEARARHWFDQGVLKPLAWAEETE